MLAMADQNGIVNASVGGLARRANLTREECDAALSTLLAPDPDSKSPEHEGRRIEALDGGWLVLNHRAYRDLRTDKQIEVAERQRRFRERHANDAALPVTDVTREAYTEAEEEEETTTTAFVYPPEFELLWNAYPRRAGSNKRQTYRLYLAHLRAGIDYDTMHSGALRYLAYVIAKSWIGTDFIKTAQVFFGRDQHFLLEWECSDIPNKSLMTKEQRDAEHYRKRGYV